MLREKGFLIDFLKKRHFRSFIFLKISFRIRSTNFHFCQSIFFTEKDSQTYVFRWRVQYSKSEMKASKAKNTRIFFSVSIWVWKSNKDVNQVQFKNARRNRSARFTARELYQNLSITSLRFITSLWINYTRRLYFCLVKFFICE